MRRVVVVGLVASLLAIAGDAAGVRSPFPRGGLLAFTCSSCPGAEVDPMIFTMRTDGRALRALAEGVGGYEPEWSPDGETIAFTRGFEAIWVMSADGREARPLFTSTVDAGGATQPTWSADGRRVAFVRNGELWTISARGGSARLLLAAPTPVVDPDWSPDGTRIAFGDVQERL